MTRRISRLLIPCTITLAFAGLFWISIELKKGIDTAYYEWGVTEAICAYAQHNEWTPPKTWGDLAKYTHCSMHFNGESRSIEDAKQYIYVDFHALTELKKRTISTLPRDTIRGLRGIEWHWIHSSDVLERLLLNNEVPNGVSCDE